MSFSIHNAKLNKRIIRDFSVGILDMSKTAINLIFHLTPYVDHDGRIHLDKEVIRKKLFCDRRILNGAINELRETSYNGKELLTYENGYLVSNFHLSTNGESTYLKHIPFFNSPEFLGLSKNQTRLFLYIATLNVKNQYTKVAIENLYKNSLHDRDYGMPVYDDYKSMVEDLFFLIDQGLVFVRLPGESSHIAKEDTEYKAHFHRMCGFVNNKKSRTSKYHKRKHVLGLKVNPELFKADAIPNEAGEAEIRLLADRYHMFHEDMKKETFNFITGKKNTLMEQFGVAGLKLYRSSLKRYFKEKNENILYYDLLGKAANHFTDFYLLTEIKKVILGAIHSELGSRGAIAATGYPFSRIHIPSLVEFFIANSADEHKILIDQEIQQIDEADELMSEVSSEEPWTSLQEAIQVVYSNHKLMVQHTIIDEFNKQGVVDPHELLSKINIKELIASLAEKSLLSQKKQLDEQSKKLKQIVRFFRKKQIPFIAPVPLKPDEPEEGVPDSSTLYNWLEE